MLANQVQNYNSFQNETVTGFASYRQLFLLLLGWLATGLVLGSAAIPLLVIFTLFLQNQGRYLYVFFAFFFTLILSDSRIYALSFSQDLKTFLMILLFLPLVSSKGAFKFDLTKSFHKPLLPFILISFFCIIFSPVPFSAFQKTLSYFLLFILIPVLFHSLHKAYGAYFLKGLVYLGTVILIAGYIMFMVNPSWVMYNEGSRSSGALGNPNGLGMFCLLFFLLYFVIRHYFPKLFTKKEHLIILFLIFSSLLWSGSRGQTLSVIIFLVTQFLSKRNHIIGLILSAFLGVMLVSIDFDIVAIAHALGFEEYLRVESLDAGGGRVVAREFAWDNIKNNLWLGKGFDYTNFLYKAHFYELSMLGHEGNAHNAFLTIWLDTGLIGLVLFVMGWGSLFYRASLNSYLAFPLAFAVLASNMVESWLAASLNPFTIQLLIVLTILINLKDSSISGKTVDKNLQSFNK